MTLDPGGLLYAAKWNTGSMTGDKTLMQSVNGGWLYLAANATYTRTDGGGGLRYGDTNTPIAEGDVIRAGQKLFANPGTYVFTETQRKPVEVMPATPGQLDAQNWLRATLTKYGQSYDTVMELPFDIDSRNATNMYAMFYSCTALTSVPQMDTGKVTDMAFMFDGCSALTTVPQLDTRNVTNMYQMFQNCTALTSVPQMDTGKVTDMRFMFNGCAKLRTAPQMDTGSVTTMRTMFQECSSLTSVPQMDTSKVQDMAYMFNRCSALTSAPKMNTSQVTTMRTMFQNCSSLTFVPEMDTQNVTEMDWMFNGCPKLTDGNASLTIKRKGATTTNMIAYSGLTREPFLTIE